MSGAEPTPLARALAERRLLVCCGPGGVGKTTTAAALGLRAARAGRRTLVLTIDPAKRLADGLGLSALGSEPQVVEAEGVPSEGLWAMMLDVRSTFERMVVAESPDEETAQRFFANRLYRLLADTMHGMQEYLAVERLYDLHESGRFDLIVLDTPPSTNALDFLDASRRLARLFDRRVIRWLLPTATAGLGRWLHPGAAVTKLLSALLGEAFVQELVDFFGAGEALIDPFRQRGEAIRALLLGPEAAFVLVTGPEPRRVEESLAFARELERHGQRPTAFIVNRALAGHDLESPVELLDDLLPGHEPEARARLLDGLRRYRSALAVQADRERTTFAGLASTVGEGAVHLVPHLGEDVHDLVALARLADCLLPSG